MEFLRFLSQHAVGIPLPAPTPISRAFRVIRAAHAVELEKESQ
jgi:hypothetical protein